MKESLKITTLGNDLFAETYCKCNDKKYKGGPLEKIMKTKLRFSGYNDNYFFDVVNKDPQIRTCDCGRQYKIQWVRFAVEIEYIGKLQKA